MTDKTLYIQRHVVLSARALWVDNKMIFHSNPEAASSDFFQELYRFMQINYLKFFKMDALSKTLFLASEALLKDTGLPSAEGNSRVALVFYNGHSSLDTDMQFQATIRSEAFFPSPSLFIYTLPNIALGEVAIRNKFMGESITFIVPNRDAEACVAHVRALFEGGAYSHVICGWFDFADDQAEADIFLVSEKETNKIFNINNLNN